jgi:hypothetical protein
VSGTQTPLSTMFGGVLVVHVQRLPLKQFVVPVHAAQVAASGPHASSAPTQVPVALHTPVASHAVRPSAQAPFLFVGWAAHVPPEHTPTLQSSVLPEQSIAVLMHTPPVQASTVQGSPSVQAAALLSVCWQPSVTSQESFVHGFPSSHEMATCEHVPVVESQLSVVHALVSEQSLFEFTTHEPSKHEFVVHASPSSHAELSAALP